ncbi:SRPBCC domain-containing protein [Robiginitalea sp. SC105]|uniref:SRPBCC family protein n=1 Tax=Robiginitalea sp. SC105 TaxID=2762332 RepID=UPI00163B3F5C|nr:SRPBCC domain-containing protein [Robiginitalea sp. SC105]MBC2840023.1 SRPBCC domain-containing protein [Robiginitalea sp. SC105]
MEGLSFSEFTKKIYIQAPVEEIYRCWATEAGLCAWFLREAAFHHGAGTRRGSHDLARVGDRYAWKWHNSDAEETGTIFEAEDGRSLGFEFAGECRVRVSLEASGGRALVTLRQYGIPTDEKSKLVYHYGCSTGWTFWLANLKAWLEHGILLNEKETDLREDPLAGFEFVNI